MSMKPRCARRRFLAGSSALAGSAAASAFLPALNANAQASSDLTELTAVAAVTAMRNGDLKSEDYAKALLARAQRLERLNAFRTMRPAMVLEAARAADQT